MQLPPIAISDIKAHQLISKRPVFVREVAPVIGACPNCAGIGAVVFSFAKGGPYQTPLNIKDAVTFADGGWYTVETKSYPCPLCTDLDARRRMLLDKSGLQETEYNWRIEYLRGKSEKGSAITAAHKILEQCPRPTGWYLVHGDYGRGKSGTLKSIVSACVKVGVSAYYTTADKILREIRDTFGDDTLADELELINTYAHYQLLAIDEVDRINDTAWARSTLFTLLNNRYDRRGVCCTLLATNCDPENMPAGFEYLASRMQDGARVRIGGIDLRGK